MRALYESWRTGFDVCTASPVKCIVNRGASNVIAPVGQLTAIFHRNEPYGSGSRSIPSMENGVIPAETRA